MIFQYVCNRCQKVHESTHRIGKAPREISCPDCGEKCERFYGEMNFILKGSAGSWPSKGKKFNREMTKRNEEAGKKMRKTWGGTQPKLIDQS